MVLKSITYDEFIARFVSTFQIDTTSWLADAPFLLDDALKDLDIKLAIPVKKITIPVVNYQAVIPTEARLLRSVYYNGKRLTNRESLRAPDITPDTFQTFSDTSWYHGITTSTVTGQCYCSGKFVLGAAYYIGKSILNATTNVGAIVVDKLSNDALSLSLDIFQGINETFKVAADVTAAKMANMYETDINGNMFFEFESGDIDLFYHYLGTSNNLPLLPDLYEVIEACKFYLLKRILMKGYIHPVYDLTSQNQFANVNIIYEGMDRRGGLKRAARVQASNIDADIRRQMAAMSAFTSNLTPNAVFLEQP